MGRFKFNCAGRRRGQDEPTSHIVGIVRGRPLLPAMLVATTLIGCSAAVDYLPDVGVAPDLRQPEILGQVAKLAASLGSTGSVDLAEPIRSQPINAQPWLVCLHLERTAANPERMYALLFKDATLEKWRPAAIVDRCEDQPFRSTVLPKPETAKPPQKS